MFTHNDNPSLEFSKGMRQVCPSCQGGEGLHISDPAALPQTLIVLRGDRNSLQE